MIQQHEATTHWRADADIRCRRGLLPTAFRRFTLPFITVSAVKAVIFGGWLVAFGAILVAVAERHDLTLWQEIIANIIYSSVVMVR